MSFGTRNVRSLYRSGSLTTVARELAKYKLDLLGVQEVRCDKKGVVRAGEYPFFYGKGQGNQLGTEFLYIREQYQQSREWSLLVLGCHIQC
jgi:hypothetical protein